MSAPFVGQPSGLTLEPFPHLTIAGLVDQAVCDALLDWLRTAAPWHGHDGGFFRQMECDLLRSDLPPACRAVTAPESLADLRRTLGDAFHTRLSDRITVIGHKLLDDYEVGIHNDAPDPGMETHRLVLRMNRREDAVIGGDLVFYASRTEKHVTASFPPALNDAVAFALSDKSFHAVHRVERGPRYSVVFSFWTSASAEIADQMDRALSEETLAALTHVLTLLGADRMEHSGRTLLHHLVGTCQILRTWGCAASLCKAGLFHSVYGTESFADALVERGERVVLRELLSEEAEQLVYLFGATSRRSLYESHASSGPAELRDAESNQVVAISNEVRRDLLLLDIANFIEQAAASTLAISPNDASLRLYRSLEASLPVPVRQSLATLGAL